MDQPVDTPAIIANEHMTPELPATPVHPGKVLLERVMTPLGVSRNKLARDIDVPVGRISEIVSGKRGVTADTALRLGKYFGTGPELWMRLQWDYDLHVARSNAWPQISERVRVLRSEQPNKVLPTAVAANEV